MNIKDRITMNSASLQERFSEVYKEFFAHCPLVVSLPGSFRWAGDFAKGCFLIKEKVPLRIYVGFEPVSSQKLIFEKGKIFIPHKGNFYEKTIFEDGEKELEKFLFSQFPQLKKQGYKIHCLSEFSPHRGYDLRATCSAALALALTVQFGITDPCLIKQWSKLTPTQLKDPKLKFTLVDSLAWKIRLYTTGILGQGSGALASMTSSKYPVLYFREAILHERSRDKLSLKDTWVSPKNIDSLLCPTFSMEEIFDQEMATSLPLDYGLIYSGEEVPPDAPIKTTHYVADLLEETKTFIKETFSQKLPQLSNEKIPLFYKLCLGEKDNLYGKYQELLTIISLEILRSFRDIFRYGLEKVENLLFNINQLQGALRFIGVSSHLIDGVCNIIKEEARKRQASVACKLTGLGKAGNILFVAPAFSLRDSISEIIEVLRKKLKREVWLDYASWIDGQETEGAKIEQFIDQGIYSKFISKGSIILKTMDEKGNPFSMTLSKEQFEKEKKNIDLLIDEIDEKIYLQGKPLTSKELHSTKMTIEILKILIKNISNEVLSHEIPDSSYNDRNEMQSKIVSPLKNVITKRLGKKLNLEVTGSLASNFSLKLLPSDIRICLLEKRF